MKKKKDDLSTIVYSTDPDFTSTPDQETVITLPPGQQSLRVTLESKHRAGKTVTLVLGFVGSESDLEELGKKLKNHCGTGGSAKDGEVILQGDQREKVKLWLLKNNYKVK
jgi:translation initiation factor 1